MCEVRFTEWTRAGGLRHPLYLGLREDKRPEDCVKETEVVLDAETDAEPSGDVPGDGAGGSDGASVVRERPVARTSEAGPGPGPRSRGQGHQPGRKSSGPRVTPRAT